MIFVLLIALAFMSSQAIVKAGDDMYVKPRAFVGSHDVCSAFSPVQERKPIDFALAASSAARHLAQRSAHQVANPQHTTHNPVPTSLIPTVSSADLHLAQWSVSQTVGPQSTTNQIPVQPLNAGQRNFQMVMIRNYSSILQDHFAGGYNPLTTDYLQSLNNQDLTNLFSFYRCGFARFAQARQNQVASTATT